MVSGELTTSEDNTYVKAERGKCIMYNYMFSNSFYK